MFHGRNLSAYWYADWLFERLGRRRFVVKGQLQRLWNKICDKYGYHGAGTHHNPVALYQQSILFRYAHGVSDGYFSPTNHRGEPHRSISCRICKKPVCSVAPNVRFIGESGERVDVYEEDDLCGPFRYLKTGLCSNEQCERIADWDSGWSYECKEARRLKVKQREKEFKKAPAAIAYLDFKARLEAAKARNLSTV